MSILLDWNLESALKLLGEVVWVMRDFRKSKVESYWWKMWQSNGTSISIVQTTAFSEAIKEGGVILSEPKKVIPPETYYLGKWLLEWWTKIQAFEQRLGDISRCWRGPVYLHKVLSPFWHCAKIFLMLMCLFHLSVFFLVPCFVSWFRLMVREKNPGPAVLPKNPWTKINQKN